MAAKLAGLKYARRAIVKSLLRFLYISFSVDEGSEVKVGISRFSFGPLNCFHGRYAHLSTIIHDCAVVFISF